MSEKRGVPLVTLIVGHPVQENLNLVELSVTKGEVGAPNFPEDCGATRTEDSSQFVNP